MEVDGCFSHQQEKKLARLCSNKTKYKSFHTAVGTLQHSKEHLAPTWTPNRDFCWIIHHEATYTGTVAYLRHRFAPPPTSMHYIWISELSVSVVRHERKYTFTYTCTRAHTHTNTVSQIRSRRSLQCFLLAFCEENQKNAENCGGRFCCSQCILGLTDRAAVSFSCKNTAEKKECLQLWRRPFHLSPSQSTLWFIWNSVVYDAEATCYSTTFVTLTARQCCRCNKKHNAYCWKYTPGSDSNVDII